MSSMIGRRQTLEESWKWQMENVPNLQGTISRDDFIDYEVKDRRGYTYHVSYLPSHSDSDMFVILAHGYTDTRFGMLKYLNFYRAMNFHCVFFDERGHGENKRVPCTYGIREVRGLLAVINDTKKRYGSHIRLGIHGESLGGATVLMSYGHNLHGNVSFVIDDCGFARILPVMKIAARSIHIPGFLSYPLSLLIGLTRGVSFFDAAPIRRVAHPKQLVPLLIIHGRNDDFIYPCHSEKIYAAYKGYKELHFVDGAYHAQSAIVNPAHYAYILDSFLHNINFF